MPQGLRTILGEEVHLRAKGAFESSEVFGQHRGPLCSRMVAANWAWRGQVAIKEDSNGRSSRVIATDSNSVVITRPIASTNHRKILRKRLRINASLAARLTRDCIEVPNPTHPLDPLGLVGV